MADIQNNAHRYLAEAQAPQADTKQREENPPFYSANEKSQYAVLGAGSFSKHNDRFDQRAEARFGSSLVCR